MNYAHLLNPEWLTAIAAIAAAIIALVALAWQAITFKLSLSADLGMKLDDRFNAPTFFETRSNAAKVLKSLGNQENAEEVFDFFDTVGLFVRQRALNATVAHSLFFHWINLYWNAGEGHIRGKQCEARLRWSDFEWLYSKTRTIEAKKDPVSRDLHLTQADMGKYLDDEIALADDSLQHRAEYLQY